FAVLFSYAEGHKIQSYGAETHFEIGKLMAKIHCLTKGLHQKRLTYTANVLLNQSLDKIRKLFPVETEETQFLVETLPILAERLSNAGNGFIRKGVVHLDIWFDNLNINGNKITLFDFDFCGNGLLCLDIAYYIIQLHNTERDEIERSKKIK